MIQTMSDFVLTDEQSKAIEELFRKRREAMGYARQADVAASVGVSQDTISRLESRFSPNVRAGELGRVMRFYGIVPNDIFTLMGLYTPPEPREGEKEYIRSDVLPLLTGCTHEQLEQIKRIVQAFVGK